MVEDTRETVRDFRMRAAATQRRRRREEAMKRTIVVWIAIAIAALALNGTFPVEAQDVPVLVDGHWLLPEPESIGMGPDPVAAQSGYEAVAYEACAYHGCDGGYLVSIMNCESGQNPGAWHANPYGGADVGIMQINDATWGSIAYAGPVEQIWWAAEMISNGLAYHWSCA